MINVGVFAGSDDGDYQFSSNSLAWLQNDLKTYAGDGRPVIYSNISDSIPNGGWAGTTTVAGSAVWMVSSTASRTTT